LSSPTTYPTRTFASHRPSCHRPPPVFIPELACSLLPPSLSNNRQLVDQLCSWSRRRFLRAPNSFPHPGLTPTGEPWATPTTCADEQHPTTASRPPAPTGRHPGPPSRPHPPTHRTPNLQRTVGYPPTPTPRNPRFTRTGVTPCRLPATPCCLLV